MSLINQDIRLHQIEREKTAGRTIQVSTAMLWVRLLDDYATTWGALELLPDEHAQIANALSEQLLIASCREAS